MSNNNNYDFFKTDPKRRGLKEDQEQQAQRIRIIEERINPVSPSAVDLIDETFKMGEILWLRQQGKRQVP